MILKKPYIILIKYFKLIHFFIGSLIIYCIYKTNYLLGFFNNYLINQNSVIGQNLQDKFYTILMFLFPIIIFFLSIFILWLMRKKNKPFRFYLYNTLVYLFVLVVFAFVYSFIGEMSSRVVDIIIVRSIRDVLIISIFIQSISLIVVFIRTIGFDIKNFEFMSDLQKLDISEDDMEEYELDLNFDFNERKRKRKRKMRFLKYSFKENRVFIFSVLVILFIIFGFILYSKTSVYNILNKEGKMISTYSYKMNVEKSYLLNTSNSGKKITDNYLVVISLNVMSDGIQNKLLTGDFKLLIDDNYYSVTNKYDKYLIDIGEVYNNNILNNEFKNYLLVYEIPNERINNSMKLVFYDSIGSVKVKINPIKFQTDFKDYQLNEEITMDGLASYVVNSYEINDLFTINYDYCIKDICYNSIQYLVPSLDTNYDKTIIKLSGSIVKKDSDNYNSLKDIISGIGYIEYKIGDNIFTSKMQVINNIKNTGDNSLYYEINKLVMEADSIKLVFNTRKYKYSYILK